MKRRFALGVALLAGLLCGSPAMAQGTWQWSITPYVWASGIDGTVRAFNQQAEVDASFGDILEVLDTAFAVVVDTRKENHRLWLDLFTVTLEESGNLTEVGPGVALEVDNTILETGYGWTQSATSPFEWYGGVRYMDVENKFRLTGQGSVTDGRDWVDPFVGVRLLAPLGGSWWAAVRGDVGGFGVGSDLAWLLGASVSYRFNDTLSGIVGYRLLDTDYEDGSFRYDVTQSGLGLALRFDL